NSIMPGHVVFVRFFLGYSDAFPFDRFLHLPDRHLDDAVEAFRKEWWTQDEKRVAYEKWYADFRQHTLDRLKQWQSQITTRPTTQPTPTTPTRPPTGPPRNLDEILGGPTEAGPTFQQIVLFEKWGTDQRLPNSRHGISNSFPLAWFDAKEHATAATEAL